jgi:ATP synthase protein I
MPQPDEEQDGALGRLGQRLDEFDAKRVRQVKSYGESGAGEGYRLLAVLIGGVIVGLGLGWLFDTLAHTSPFGLIGGLLIGTGASVYMIARSATRTSGLAEHTRPVTAPVADQKSAVFEDDNDG